MNKKIIYLSIFLVLVLALFLVSGCTQSAVGLARDPSKEVKANSCNADELCEMNGAQIVNGAEIGMLKDKGQPTLIVDPISAEFTKPVIFNGSKRVTFTGEVYFTDSISYKNAYACLDPNGKLFRSLTPCTNVRNVTNMTLST